jgi:hypothetical protein
MKTIPARHLCLRLSGPPAVVLFLLFNGHSGGIVQPVHLLLVSVIHRLLLHRHLAAGAVAVPFSLLTFAVARPRPGAFDLLAIARTGALALTRLGAALAFAGSRALLAITRAGAGFAAAIVAAALAASIVAARMADIDIGAAAASSTQTAA